MTMVDVEAGKAMGMLDLHADIGEQYADLARSWSIAA